jgi:hypothetical protein
MNFLHALFSAAVAACAAEKSHKLIKSRKHFSFPHLVDTTAGAGAPFAQSEMYEIRGGEVLKQERDLHIYKTHSIQHSTVCVCSVFVLQLFWCSCRPSVAQERLTPNQKFLHGRQRFVLLTDKWTLRILIQRRARDIAVVRRRRAQFLYSPAAPLSKCK